MNYEELKKLRKKINNNIFIKEYVNALSYFMGSYVVFSFTNISGILMGAAIFFLGSRVSKFIGEYLEVDENIKEYCLEYADTYFELEKSNIDANSQEVEKSLSLSASKKEKSAFITMIVSFLVGIALAIGIYNFFEYSNIARIVIATVSSIPLAIGTVFNNQKMDEKIIIEIIKKKIDDYKFDLNLQESLCISLEEEQTKTRPQNLDRAKRIEELEKLKRELMGIKDKSKDKSKDKPKTKAKHK